MIILTKRSETKYYYDNIIKEELETRNIIIDALTILQLAQLKNK